MHIELGSFTLFSLKRLQQQSALQKKKTTTQCVRLLFSSLKFLFVAFLQFNYCIAHHCIVYILPENSSQSKTITSPHMTMDDSNDSLLYKPPF